VPALGPVADRGPKRDPRAIAQGALAAASRTARAVPRASVRPTPGSERRAAAVARVHVDDGPKTRQCLRVRGPAVRLPEPGRPAAPEVRGGRAIGSESEPVEVVEERPLELRPTALAIVVLDPQEDRSARRSGEAPDV